MDSPHKILSELHDRSVWQVLVVYLVGGWATYQIVLGVWEGIGLPDWVPPTALTLIIAGLPLVVATALVQKGGPIRSAPDETPITTESGQLEPHPRLTAAGSDQSRTPRTVSRLLSWRSVFVLAVGAVLSMGVATGGYMGMRAAGIGPMGTLLAKGTVERADELLITTFESPEDEVTGRLAAELLRTAFDMSHLLRLPGQKAVADALKRMGSDRSTPGPDEALELAEREGWELVVLGEVRSVGDGYVITARLVAVGTGEDLGRFSATAQHADDFVDAMNEIADGMHERIGASYKSIRQMPHLAKVTTSSLEALKAYSEAMWVRDWKGNPEAAIPLLERAIAMDSTFGAAYRQLSITLYNLGREDERRIEAHEMARRYKDRMTPFNRFRMEAVLPPGTPEDELRRLTHQVAAYEQYVQANPHDRRPLVNLGHFYALMGRYEDAVAVTERLLEGDRPVGSLVWINLCLYRAFAGDLDGAEQALEQLDPGSQSHAWGAWNLALARGDPGRAHDILHESGFRPYWVLLTDVALGRFAEAEQHLEERTRQLAGSAAATTALHWIVAMETGRALIVPDRRDETARRLVRALDEAPDDSLSGFLYLELAGALALTGDTDRARRYLEAGLERVPELRLRETVMWPRAEILLAEGRFQEAIATFRDADRGFPGRERDLLGPLGRAYMAAGKVDSAVAAFERLLASPPGAEVYVHNGWLLHRPLAHRALARVYRDRGENDKAARHYARLIEWWGDADPMVQSDVEEAERWLESLTTD